jgi:dephospho-CoA kinase
LQVLERLGAAGLSTDRVVHELYDSDAVRNAVVGRFGPSVLSDGTVDRRAVAEVAFSSDEHRGWLERLLWPRVGACIGDWRRNLELCAEPPRAAVVEVPLLFESGLEGVFDATIAVIADEQRRHERASGRGHQALDERLARQFSQEEKAQRATYVVVNDGSVDELESELSSILDMLGT